MNMTTEHYRFRAMSVGLIFLLALGAFARCARAEVVRLTDGLVITGGFKRISATEIVVTNGIYRGLDFDLKRIAATDAARFRAMPITPIIVSPSVGFYSAPRASSASKSNVAARASSFSELATQIHANQLRAEKELAGQRLKFSGIVSGIEGNRTSPKIYFEGQDATGYFMAFEIQLNVDQFDRAASLSKGDAATVECSYRGIQILPIFEGGILRD